MNIFKTSATSLCVALILICGVAAAPASAAVFDDGVSATAIGETSLGAPEIGNEWSAVTYGKGLFVASSDYGPMTSPDGIKWTLRTGGGNWDRWSSIAYGGGMFVAVSGSADNNAMVMTSPDGINWTLRLPVTPSDGSSGDGDWGSWDSITYGNGLFVAVSLSGYDGSPNQVMTSPDGITWTFRPSGVDNKWISVTYGNGLFVAVSWEDVPNPVMTSPDGIIWTPRAAGSGSWSSVTYGNGLFVAVAYRGTPDTNREIMTSPDGINWTLRHAPSSGLFGGVAYGGGRFVVVSLDGSNNQVMTSLNGINWTSRTAVAGFWDSVTYGGGMFVAVAGSGGSQGGRLNPNRVMTSPDGVNWTLRTEPVYDPSNVFTISKVKVKITKKFIELATRFNLPSPGIITIKATTRKGTKIRTRCEESLYVTQEDPGLVTMTCKIVDNGRRELRKAKMTLTVRTTFTPGLGGKLAAKTQTVKLAKRR